MFNCLDIDCAVPNGREEKKGKQKKQKKSIEDSETRSTHSESSTSSSKSKYDMIVVEDTEPECELKEFSLYFGEGYALSTQEYRNKWYLCFSREMNGAIKNRFNIPVEKIEDLIKTVKCMSEYMKNL